MDCSHTSQLSIPSKIVLYGHLERKLCLKYGKMFRDTGMAGNNFVSYSFWLFITLFYGPYGVLDYNGVCDPSPKGLKVF